MIGSGSRESGASDLPEGAVERLERWLARHVPAFTGPIAIRRFEGGQSNPTYRLDAPSGAYVLRRKPYGSLLESAHAVDREFRAISALRRAGAPVPEPHAYCADEQVIGAVFYVMEFVGGRVFFDQRLPDLAPAERAAIYDSMNATIAQLHGFEPASLGLADFGRPGNFVARQVSRWSRQYKASETHEIPAMDRLIEWLPRNTPQQAAETIVHGDYRLDNLIIDAAEPRVNAVLDWELSTIGDPVADFSYHAMTWRIPPGVFRGLAGVDLATLGIPHEAAYVERYSERTGRDVARHWDFYMAYSMFRIAAIIQGIARRAADGSAASDDAARVGKAAEPIAALAWDVARGARLGT